MKVRLAPLRGACGVDRPQPVVSACGLNHRLLSQIPAGWVNPEGSQPVAGG
jgi:hypothetical protein